jgi:MFS family permease
MASSNTDEKRASLDNMPSSEQRQNVLLPPGLAVSHDSSGPPSPNPNLKGDGRIEITEDDCYDELGFSYSSGKKWFIITVIFWVQVTMNFNTSVYNNAVAGMAEEFSISQQAARCGSMIFLIMYAFGCELWAPWSEEFGRWPVLQLSLFLVNLWQLPVALAPNFASVMVGRALGGLSTAGGSVTLAVIADLWPADEQQYAVAYVVLSSVGGSLLGPIFGGFIEEHLDWR